MKLFKKIGLSLIIFVINMTNVQAAEVKSELDAILALGSQMSNVRAMLENYTLIGAKIPFKDPGKRLEANIVEYESLLDDLSKNFKDPIIQETVEKSRASWKPVKKALMTALKDTDREQMRKEAQFIHDNVRSVIKKLASMKKYFLGKVKIKNPDELDASIEIAASARRLSAHYMMKMWKLPDPTIEKHWDNGVKIYTKSVAVLKKSSFYKDAEFKAWLDKTDKILKYLIMTSSFDDTFMPAVVHDKCEVAYANGNKMSGKIIAE